jgi:hypothetical protein
VCRRLKTEALLERSNKQCDQIWRRLAIVYIQKRGLFLTTVFGVSFLKQIKQTYGLISGDIWNVLATFSLTHLVALATSECFCAVAIDCETEADFSNDRK